jgi:hypothetical protein
LHQSAVGLGIALVSQFGDETDDALRQNIGFLKRRKMATRLRNRPAPEIEKLLGQLWASENRGGRLIGFTLVLVGAFTAVDAAIWMLT